MQTQLEWGQKKFIKFEMKKGRSKEENKLKQGFPNSTERWRTGSKFWAFLAFIMLQIRFSSHRLIKISIIYLYTRPEVKKTIQQQ